MPFKLFLDQREKFVTIERFGQIGVGTCFYALQSLLFRYFSRYYNDRNMVDNLVRAYLAADLQPADAGNHKVRNDKVRNELQGFLQPFTPVRSI